MLSKFSMFPSPAENRRDPSNAGGSNSEVDNGRKSKLIRRRTIVKEQFARIHTYIWSLEEHTCNKYEVKVRLERLEKLMKEFDDVQFEIENAEVENDRTNTRERKRFEDQYFTVAARCKRLLDDGTLNRPSGAMPSVKSVIDLLTADETCEKLRSIFDTLLNFRNIIRELSNTK